jgi:hypothetical protein
MVDGYKNVYGGGMTTVKHLTNRFTRCRTAFSFDSYKSDMDKYFNWISKNIQYLTQRTQFIKLQEWKGTSGETKKSNKLNLRRAKKEF